MRRSGPDHAGHPAVGRTKPARAAGNLGGEEGADLCRGCVQCCTYITVEIDPPRAAWEYDQWVWVLHHRGIQLYVERPERWYLHVETVCRHLNADGRCAIYGRRPELCRKYDALSCERRLPVADLRAWFADARALEEWLRRERPAHWKRLMSSRAERQGVPPAPGAGRGDKSHASFPSLAARPDSRASARPLSVAALARSSVKRLR